MMEHVGIGHFDEYFLNDRPNPPEHIIIETSGLALPKPLVKAFQWPAIRARATVDEGGGADRCGRGGGRSASPAGRGGAWRRAARPILARSRQPAVEELYGDQLACADLIVLNKADLVDGDTLARVERGIDAETRAGVRIVRATHGAVDATVLLGLTAAAEGDLDARPSHHDSEEDHDHDDFDSFVVTGGRAADPAALLAAIGAAIAAHDILRVKGFVAVRDKPARLRVQAVGPRIQHHFDRAWTTGEPRRARVGGDRPERLGPRRDRTGADGRARLMHLLSATPGTVSNGEEAIDLAQSPGDIVILTASATANWPAFARARPPAMLGPAGPSVRLANLLQLRHPYSVGLYAEGDRAGALRLA